MKRYWRIRGYDSTEQIFDLTVGIGQFSNRQIEDCIKALAAQAGLNYKEIVGAYAKRRTKIANSLLDVHWDVKHGTCMCGSNPHFTAAMVDENGNIVRRLIRSGSS